jgi:hypothetical protein
VRPWRNARLGQRPRAPHWRDLAAVEHAVRRRAEGAGWPALDRPAVGSGEPAWGEFLAHAILPPLEAARRALDSRNPPPCDVSHWSQRKEDSMPSDVPVPAVVDPETLLAKAIEHNVSIDALERLLALRERLAAERARTEFFTALASFQGECPIIPKRDSATIVAKSGARYTYRYASLDDIVRVTAPLLAARGLATRVETAIDAGQLCATCVVHHVGGHSEASTFRVPIATGDRMNPAQQVASASTYAKRYAYCNALGILTGDEDDDARGSGEPPRDRERVVPTDPADSADTGRDGSYGGDPLERTTRTSLAKEIQGELVAAYPGQSAGEKRAKADLIAALFGTRSWTVVEHLDSARLRAGLAALRERLGRAGSPEAATTAEPEPAA